MSYKTRFLLLACCFALLPLLPAEGALSLPGPTGFVSVPSHRTIQAKQIELGIHGQIYDVPLTNKTERLTHFAFGFSPFRDFELGIAGVSDSNNNAETPDPTLNFKVRLPSLGEGEFSEMAFGGVFDTNENNYHTLYLTFGGIGLGWNFGGSTNGGIAHYGGYDKDKHKPKTLCLLIGAELPEPNIGERGYKSRYYIDYNGDYASLGYRYSSHRGFWVDASVRTKSDYDDAVYDVKPFMLGFGANF